MTELDHDRNALDLLPAVQAEISRENHGWRRVRSWTTRAQRGTFVAVLAAVEVLVVTTTPRPDLEVHPPLRLALGVGLLAILATLGVGLFLRPPHRRAPRPSRLIAAAVALLLVPVAYSLLPAPHDAVHMHPESFVGTGADFVKRAAGCLMFGMLVALPLTSFAVAIDRRQRFGRGRIALVAGASGLAGTLGLILHCPLVSVVHRVVSHGTVGLAVGLTLSAALFLLRRRRGIRATP